MLASERQSGNYRSEIHFQHYLNMSWELARSLSGPLLSLYNNEDPRVEKWSLKSLPAFELG